MTKPLTHVGMTLCAVLLLALSYGCTKSEGAAKGEELFGRCTNCHGEKGEGKRHILAPAIAGLPAWYVENQLEKYANGLRGGHLNDVAGHRMRPMARTLVRPSDAFKLIAAHVETMPPVAQIDDMGGDIENGESLFGQCTACHGTKGEGMANGDAIRANFSKKKDWRPMTKVEKLVKDPKKPNDKGTLQWVDVENEKCPATYNFASANPWAPPLRNASPWYVVEQLKKFKKKWRGNHECDHLGKQMHQWAGNLSERDMTDVAAYLHSLSTTQTVGK